jgi:hypothetical protein
MFAKRVCWHFSLHEFKKMKEWKYPHQVRPFKEISTSALILKQFLGGGCHRTFGSPMIDAFDWPW